MACEHIARYLAGHGGHLYKCGALKSKFHQLHCPSRLPPAGWALGLKASVHSNTAAVHDFVVVIALCADRC